jgi:hypothetical protein
LHISSRPPRFQRAFLLKAAAELRRHAFAAPNCRYVTRLI